jgi:hypothetical protein
MNPWLAQHVETTDELDYQPALNWFGLHFPSDEPVAPETTSEDTTPQATPPADAASAASAEKDGADAKQEEP